MQVESLVRETIALIADSEALFVTHGWDKDSHVFRYSPAMEQRMKDLLKQGFHVNVNADEVVKFSTFFDTLKRLSSAIQKILAGKGCEYFVCILLVFVPKITFSHSTLSFSCR